MIKKGVYAGSFNPITNGHVWVIKKGAELLDELIVAVGVNPDKKGLFSLNDRINLIKGSCSGIKNIIVDSYNELTVDFARKAGAQYLLRGVRTCDDFNYESNLSSINYSLNENLTTLLLLSPPNLSNVSSSLIRGLIGKTDWEIYVKDLIPRIVHDSLLKELSSASISNWRDLCKKIGVTDKSLINETYDYLTVNYLSADRSYHNLCHVSRFLREIDSINCLLNRHDEVKIAAWFHDVIYDTHSKTNEEDSASQASLFLNKAGKSSDFIDYVLNLIMSTKHNSRPESLDAQYLVDIDYSIIGCSEHLFNDSAKSIRKEYSWAPISEFVKARKAFLQDLQGKEQIYYTPYYRSNYEAQARVNIDNELIKLSSI